MADPQKQYDAVAKALELDEGATPEALLRKLKAIVDFLAAGEDPPADAPADAPPEEAAASNEPEDTVAASDEQPDKIEASADSEDAVEASDEPGDQVELMEDMAETDPAAGEAGALVTMLAEMTGMDEASVLAALREQAEQVAAVLSGQPDDGMPAEEGETGMSADKQAALEASRANTKAAQAKLTKANAEIAKLTKRLDTIEAERRKDRVEAAIAAGHITRASAKPYLALARTGGKDFEELMAEAAASPEVPTGTVAAGHGSDVNAEDNVTPEAGLDHHPDVVKLTKRLGHLASTASGQREIEAAKKRIANSDYEGRA